MVMLLNQSPLYQSYLETECSGQSFFLKSGGGAGTGYLIIGSCIMFLISHYSTFCENIDCNISLYILRSKM